MVCRFREIVSVCILFVVLAGCNPQQTTSRSDIAVPLMEGDVVFRRGNGAASHAVLAMNSSGTYSHVGVIIVLDTTFYVVHEVPYEGKTTKDDCIKCETIHQFFHPDKATSGAIYRMDLSEQHRAIINQYLVDQLNLVTPFDHDYDLLSDSAMYCTELVWQAFLKIGVDLSEERLTKVCLPAFNGYYLLPSDLEQNSKLKNIYHF